MKDTRFRVPVDTAYVESLGRAAYIFAILEWNAVWCCERMRPTYISKIGKKTAGMIANDLLALVTKHHAGNAAFTVPAQEFRRLVDVRNSILHGKPGTATTGKQRLFHAGMPWTPTLVDEAADAFTECSSLLNALLYNQLK